MTLNSEAVAMKPNLPLPPLTRAPWVGVPMNAIRLATIHANLR